MQIWETSTQKLYVPVYGPDGVDLTQYPVALALVDETLGEPAQDAYVAAQWVTTGQQVAWTMITAGTYPPDDYMAWAQVTGSDGEVPVIQCGRVRIGDGVSPAGSPGAPVATWVTSINGQAGSVVLPVGQDLEYAESIAFDAAGLNDLAVTLAGDAALADPTGLTPWQILRFHVTQGAGGPWTLTYGGLFNFGASAAPVLSTDAGDTDIVGFQYDPNLTQLCYMGTALGFRP